ncbi:MAG: energy transducer TonB [Bacteroidia bacterium]|nr:energy transducer TonB [Bacteroidia bacterium]
MKVLKNILIPAICLFPFGMDCQSVGMCALSVKDDSGKIKIDTMFFDIGWNDLPNRFGASFYRVFEKTAGGYNVEDRFINNSIQMTAFSTIVKEPLNKTGKAVYYNQNGYVSQVAHFKSNVKTGEAIWYYKNQTDSTVGKYNVYGSLTYSVNSTLFEINNNDGNGYEIDEVPYLKQGVPNLHDVVQKSIVIPASLRSKKFNIKAIIEFTVTTDGRVENAKVKRSCGESSLDNEALKVVNALPKFIPGKKKGVKIPFALVIPVTFVN